jgi:Protein of unknown function (DUF4235)
MKKLLYRPVGMLAGIAAGLVARAVFERVWKVVAGEDEAPQPTDARRRWPEVLLAAALQGVIFSVVKAAVNRGAATGTEKLTGVWPGDGAEQPGEEAR